MDEKQQKSDYQQSDERFNSVLTELTQIKEAFVMEELQFYVKQAKLPRLLFSITGILIIMLSVSIPFLSTLEGIWRHIILPIVALMVAGLTGLSSFFRWERTWKGHIQTRITLEYLLSVWNLQITQARHEVDIQKGIEIAINATKQLLDDTHKTVSAETKEHFERLQIPREQQSQ